MKIKLPTAFFKELNAWINKFWPDLLFVIVLVLCLWPILSIGLGLIPLIKCNFNSVTIDKFNTVILNLSYSYIAGCIFYYLSVVFPGYKNKKEIKPAVKLKISNIKSQLSGILLEFSRNTGLNHNAFNDLKICKNIMMSKEWNDIVQMLLQNNRVTVSYLKLCLLQKIEILKEIESLIIGYKSFLNTEQLLLLEQIRNCSFFSQISFLSSFLVIDITDQNAKEFLADDFCKLIELYNKLERTV